MKKARKDNSIHFNDIIFSKMSEDELNVFLSIYPSLKDEVIQKMEEERFGEEFPSKVVTKTWVYATCNGCAYPEYTKSSGKWCVFVKHEALDEWFQKIKQALHNGKLGSEIKSSTRRSKMGTQAAIMVYTYDSDDVDDVFRVRNSLKELGITWKLHYKTDENTRNRNYSANSLGGVSKYCE